MRDYSVERLLVPLSSRNLMSSGPILMCSDVPIVLTRRGEAVRRTIRDAVTELEREWATLLGRRRFAMLKHLLRQLYDARVQAAPSSVAGTGRARS